LHPFSLVPANSVLGSDGDVSALFLIAESRAMRSGNWRVVLEPMCTAWTNASCTPRSVLQTDAAVTDLPCPLH
jgi:hypothetical protein